MTPSQKTTIEAIKKAMTEYGQEMTSCKLEIVHKGQIMVVIKTMEGVYADHCVVTVGKKGGVKAIINGKRQSVKVCKVPYLH